MKILVLIDNNLQHDNRVKRHIQLMLDKGAEVEVIARPIPDHTPGMNHSNLKFNFWDSPSITMDVEQIKALAQKLQVWELLWRSFPGIQTSVEKAVYMSKYYSEIQSTLLSAPWWSDFNQSIAEESADPIQEHAKIQWIFEFFLRWSDHVADVPADIIYCNDIGTLLCGVVHKLKWNSRLIFDAHEIYCDLVPGGHSRLWKNTMALYENNLAPIADALIGVSPSHVEWMKKTHGVTDKSICIPNCPGDNNLVPPEPKEFSLPLRIYYHGASDQWRGLKNLVHAVSRVKDVSLVLRCLESDHLNEVRALVQEISVEDKVKFLPVVTNEQIINACREDGDIGIHACDVRFCLNIGVGLSNKFGEYLKAGLPVITSPLIEQARIVTDNQIGIVLEDNSIDSITNGINELLEKRDQLKDMQVRSFEAGQRIFDWANYSEELWETVRG